MITSIFIFSAFTAVISAVISAFNAVLWTTIEPAYESTDEVSKCATIYTAIVTAF